MKLDKFYKVIQETDPADRALISKNMDILERIHELLEQKFGGRQKDLAARMCKSEAEISKVLSGLQNFTMKTIIKFEIAFDDSIMVVKTNRDLANSDFVQVKICEHLKTQTVEIPASIEGDNGGQFSKAVRFSAKCN